MNKQLANQGSMLNKNMTHTETLIVNNLEVTTNVTLPVYTHPYTPSNPKEGCFYIKKNPADPVKPYELMYYVDGIWY